MVYVAFVLTEKQEATRQKLLKEEREMRAKQPVAWAAQKYRKYALYKIGIDKLRKETGATDLTKEQLSGLAGKTMDELKKTIGKKVYSEKIKESPPSTSW